MPVIDFSEITRQTLDQLARVGRATVVPSTCGSKAAEVLIDAAAVLNDGDEQTHEKSDPKHGIALPAVPEQFFDQDFCTAGRPLSTLQRSFPSARRRPAHAPFRTSAS